MQRYLIFGNSGSGKSTYASRLSQRLGLPHLDLDTLAWDPQASTPTRLPLAQSEAQILAYIQTHGEWIIEGCYADLLAFVLPHCGQLVFLNPGIETCLSNARNRPWEPHKYPSKEAQDANLPMLLDWIRQYATREDEFSLAAHRRLFAGFTGPKDELTSNDWLAAT